MTGAGNAMSIAPVIARLEGIMHFESDDQSGVPMPSI
jgi:hypothetical protein